MTRTAARFLVIGFVLVLAAPLRARAQVVRVPGTKVTMTPPPGFQLAKQYPGFETTQASIMVTELPVSAAQMMRSMTASALATKGMVLTSSTDVTVNDRAARLLSVRQKTPAGEFPKWLLIAGDDQMTIMIVGTFTNDAPALGESLRSSLLTATWGSAAPSSPFEGLPFRIAPTERMKLARRVSNMIMFTESGTIGSPGSSEAIFIVGHSLGRGQVSDLRAFSESRAKQTNTVTALRNIAGNPTTVAGREAYELEADATAERSGHTLRLYQVIVPDPTGYFILQGLMRADAAAQLLPEFRALTGSFRIVEP